MLFLSMKKPLTKFFNAFYNFGGYGGWLELGTRVRTNRHSFKKNKKLENQSVYKLFRWQLKEKAEKTQLF